MRDLPKGGEGKKKAAQSGSASRSLHQTSGPRGNGQSLPGRGASCTPQAEPLAESWGAACPAALPALSGSAGFSPRPSSRFPGSAASALLPCIIRPSARSPEQVIGDLSSCALSDWLLGEGTAPPLLPAPFCCFCPLACSCFLRFAGSPFIYQHQQPMSYAEEAQLAVQARKHVQEKVIGENKSPGSTFETNKICGRVRTFENRCSLPQTQEGATLEKVTRGYQTGQSNEQCSL